MVRPQKKAACDAFAKHVMKKGNNNMNRKPFMVGLIVGGLIGFIPGFGLGVYFLPIIVAKKKRR